MNMKIFIVILLVILAVIYLMDLNCGKESFDSNSNSNLMYINSYTPEPIDYSTRKQDCNELTYNPEKCVVDTVIPSGSDVCDNSLTPITNNQKEYKKNKKIKKTPNLSLRYDFDLLSSFNGAQLNDIQTKQEPKNSTGKTNSREGKYYVDNSFDLETEIRSLNSLENDLISNY